MKENLHLKRGLIIQSLSPVFALLIIRHFHCDYFRLIPAFFADVFTAPAEIVMTALCHPRFGELLISVMGVIWILFSVFSIHAFEAVQDSDFNGNGEKISIVAEQKDAAASFLMTFILPLLIDELSSPQYWFSYILVILIVYAVLYQSNLYFPVLALLGYKVFKFKVLNSNKYLKKEREYIGITKKKTFTEGSAIQWKLIADDVLLVYSERKKEEKHEQGRRGTEAETDCG